MAFRPRYAQLSADQTWRAGGTGIWWYGYGWYGSWYFYRLSNPLRDLHHGSHGAGLCDGRAFTLCVSVGTGDRICEPFLVFLLRPHSHIRLRWIRDWSSCRCWWHIGSHLNCYLVNRTESVRAVSRELDGPKVTGRRPRSSTRAGLAKKSPRPRWPSWYWDRAVERRQCRVGPANRCLREACCTQFFALPTR